MDYFDICKLYLIFIFPPDDPQKLAIVQSICEKPVTNCKRKKAAYYLYIHMFKEI